MNKTLKKTICISTALFLSTFVSANKTNVKGKYASYSKGNVYISSETPYELTDNPYDVFVLDRRSKNNPNMKVCNSCRILSVEEQQEIIDILLRYEEEYPSRWERSKESLQKEWLVHNLLYSFGIEIERTRDVDFDNEDEEVYKVKKLKR